MKKAYTKPPGKAYTKPLLRPVLFTGPPLMLDGGHSVSDYKQGTAINVGDDDDEPAPTRNFWYDTD
ncbi:MAG: hypothetical protein J6M53_05050 [Bacteroidaceae bacterium]|nr:hypothetical protein [Bacteroidaceae bacterium]